MDNIVVFCDSGGMTDIKDPYDLFIIGGGINGAGIARDAAGRGLSVFLCERDDIAQGSSSASTKLIHGGLRYLEFYDLRHVREASGERELLLQAAPQIVWPMEFVMPHSAGMGPPWLVRLGLFIYDLLARRKVLPRSYQVDLRQSRFGKPLKKYVRKGFVYADCWVEDSRLVVLTCLDAAQRGAEINNYTQFLNAERIDHLWRIFIKKPDGTQDIVYARTLVNATGPAVQKVAEKISGTQTHLQPMRLVKGMHVVVPRLYDGQHAYILQHPDRRIVFVIPFEDDYTLVGMADQPATSETAHSDTTISAGEEAYMLDAVNVYFTKQLTRADIKYRYAGVRPLFDDGSTDHARVLRDYMLTLEDGCLNIYGGKVTNFRQLAQEAVDMILASQNQSRPGWTAGAVLPGGDFDGSLDDFGRKVMAAYPFLPEAMALRLASQYGTRLHDMLRGARSLDEMGVHFGGDLYAREVDFMLKYEWVHDVDDILQRRTRIGLMATAEMRQRLAAYVQEHQGAE